MDSSPGTYAVLLEATQTQAIAIGRFGTLTIQPGIYVYIGSAFGPGGLAARVGRHWRGGAVRRWHIDYLRAVTQPMEVWFTVDATLREHIWANVMRDLPNAMIPMAGFGASDCDCEAHLFYFAEMPSLAQFRRRYIAQAREVALVQRWSRGSTSQWRAP